MLITINKNDIDVNMSEQTNAKFVGIDRHEDIAKCINSALADLSMPLLDMNDINVVREGTIVDSAQYPNRVCFSYDHGEHANYGLFSLNKVVDADTHNGITSLINERNVVVNVVFGKDNTLELEGLTYVTTAIAYDVRITVEISKSLIANCYREAFVEKVLGMDKCATVMGSGVVVTNSIKRDSICVNADHEHRMFLGMQHAISFSECPVFVRYTNNRLYVKHGAFIHPGVCTLAIPGYATTVAYCYAPGYAFMGSDFKYDALIEADNIVELEHALAITSAVNNNIVVNAARGTPSRANVDWYVERQVLDHSAIAERIDTMIAKTIAHSDSEYAEWLGGAPGYDRFYDVLSSIIRMVNSDDSFTIKSEEIVGFICGAMRFDSEDLKVTSMEDFIKSDAFKRAIGNASGLWSNDASDELIGKVRAILASLRLRPETSEKLLGDVIVISKAISELINSGCECDEIATIFNTLLLDIHNGTNIDVLRGAEDACGKTNHPRAQLSNNDRVPERTDKVRNVICDAICDLCIDVDERKSEDVDVLIKICDHIHNDVKDLSIAETMAVLVSAFDGVGSFRNADTEEIAENILHGARRSRFRSSQRNARRNAKPQVMHVDRTKIRECIDAALIENGVSPAESNSGTIGRINGSITNIIENAFDGHNDKPMAKIVACALLNYADTAPIALCLYNHRLVEIIDMLVKDAAKTMTDSEMIDFINKDEMEVIFNDLHDHVTKLISRVSRTSKYTW